MAYNTIELGGLYQLTTHWRLGLMIKNWLGFALKNEYRDFHLPRNYTLGIAWRSDDTSFEVDNEWIWGNFGGIEEKSAEIWLLRAGIERAFTAWLSGRVGLIYPMIARTSTLGNLKDEIPSPGIGATAGIGLSRKQWRIDMSLYGDPARSYVEQRKRLASALSLTYRF